MKKVSVNNIHATIGTKFATIEGYPKKDGTLSNINFSMGVHVRTKGGTWTGDTTKHMLVHKPAHPKNTNPTYNGYRTLLKDSLIGCTLKANGEVYKIVK